jgi:hypothetical protein
VLHLQACFLGACSPGLNPLLAEPRHLAVTVLASLGPGFPPPEQPGVSVDPRLLIGPPNAPAPLQPRVAKFLDDPVARGHKSHISSDIHDEILIPFATAPAGSIQNAVTERHALPTPTHNLPVAGSAPTRRLSTMGPVSFLRSLYDLDTLDTRFTTPSSIPYKTVADARSDTTSAAASKTSAPGRPEIKTQPSKWNTPEFYLYFAVIIAVVPYMFWIAYDVSRRTPDTSLLARY